MMNPEKESITLISSDLNPIEIKTKAAMRSNLIKNLIEDYPQGNYPMNEVNYETLLKVKDYLDHYENLEPKEISQPLPKKDFIDCVDNWDYDYININKEKIFEIMLAANFMDIQPLLDLTCAKIASEIRGKNEEDIRKVFNFEKGCDEDEEEDNIKIEKQRG